MGIEAINGPVRSEPLNRNFSYLDSKLEQTKNDLRGNFEFVYDVIGFNDHTIIPTYDENGKVSKIEEKDGQTTVATFDFTYNLDGSVDTVVQTYNGQSITYKFNYTDGEFTSITKTLSGGGM